MKPLVTGKLAALILATTLAAAASAASGDELPAAQGSREAAAEPVEASRNRAADAHAEAVAKAADALISATKLDLDIRLVSHTSVQVANDLH